MKARFYADFPTNTQYRGRHFFFTMRERREFLRRAADRGYTPLKIGALTTQRVGA